MESSGTGSAVKSKTVTETHKWRFFMSGGFDQVRLDRGSDLANLDKLDQKLWAALACPVEGLEFDSRTLLLIDTDGDGRIRAPEVVAAAKWASSVLKDPSVLLDGSPELRLADIDDSNEEGARILALAKSFLVHAGKPDAEQVSVDDLDGVEATFAKSPFNGDGVIPPASIAEEDIKTFSLEVIETVGGPTDLSGESGVSRESLAEFTKCVDDFLAWHARAQNHPETCLPLGPKTPDAVNSMEKIKVKVEDWFTRSRLAAYDPGKTELLNRSEAHFAELASKTLAPDAEGLADFPLCRVDGGRELPLSSGVNPAWAEAVNDFRTKVLDPLVGSKGSLSPEDWEKVKTSLTGATAWLSEKPDDRVEKIGLERLSAILAGDLPARLLALIEKDESFKGESDDIKCVARLVRFNRDLARLASNFVNFRDFYTLKEKASFQSGTLYLDGRSLDLCIRVGDVAKHASLATLGRTYLVYCDCVRKGGTDRLTIAAAFTDGDSDRLMVGRNGIFYDRDGNDYDATIVRIIEHPIGLRQAFFAPYKRVARMIGDQLEKMAASRDKAVMDRAQAHSGGKAWSREDLYDV